MEENICLNVEKYGGAQNREEYDEKADQAAKHDKSKDDKYIQHNYSTLDPQNC